GKCPGCGFTPRTGKTRDLNKHMDLTRSRPCQALLQLTQVQNTPQVKNATPEQNPVLTPEGDLISFNKNPSTHHPREARELAINLLTGDIPDIEVESAPNTYIDQKKFNLMESDDNKDSEPSDSEYDTADKDPDVYFEKRKDPYINRKSKAENFNEGEVCDYYVFVPKGYYTENEPLGFFESIEEKIGDIYKRELALKGELKVRIVLIAYMKKIMPESPEPTFKSIPFKHNTIEIIREDRINATIEKEYNEIIDEIEDEALQEKPPHLNEIQRLRRNANIANFEGIKFPATLHDVNKFEENNPNYAINIFTPFYREAFGKIIVDIDPLHISEQNYQVAHMIDLLYLTEDFERLLHKWNNHHGKKYFCRKCLRFPYSRLDLLQEHIPKCLGPSKASQHLILSEEGNNYVKPKYIKNIMIKPYLISMDLEAEEIKVEKEDKEGNTIKEVEQKVISYGYTIHCSDGKTQKPVINRESKNVIKDLMYNLQEDLDVILDKLCDPLPCEKMTPKLWRQYQTANKCWICEEKLHESGYNKIRVFDPESKKYLGASHRKCHGKKPMIQGKLDDEQKKVHGACKKCMYCKTQLPDEGKNRVLDHDHITGKFRGASHNECNLKLRIDPETIKFQYYYVMGVAMIFTI
ncbi:11398_t:CDS:2, partial [Acaulospora morrowiae]